MRIWCLLTGVLLGVLVLQLRAPEVDGQLFSVFDPACGNWTLIECQVRKKLCKGVAQLFETGAGPVKSAFDCADALGIPKMRVIAVIGEAFKSGQPETIIDLMFDEVQIQTALRRCILNATGLLGEGGETIDRLAMAAKARVTLYKDPSMAAAVAAAAKTCPHPENLKYSEMVSCLKTACMHGATIDPEDPFGTKKKCKNKKDKKCKKKRH
ncbi:uncharacterized protein LOC143024002 [Oratosquilla oratoria]|uniref:uncharacterized protein LOC143024002 n=1 Tax=Oratosquilla oratoria TaxID=337810 RepID=UPI003F7774A4